MKKHYSNIKLKSAIKASCFIVLLLLTAQPTKLNAQLSGTNYTIDANQAASNTNYRNFQAFFDDIWNGTRNDGGSSNGPGISAAVEVDVAANQTFNQQVQVRPHVSLNANRRVTIKGNNALLTFNATSSSARHTLWMNGADYFTFDGLRIHGTHNLYAYVVRLSSQADYNVFKNCEISAPNYNYKGSDNNRDYAIDGAFTVTMRAETSAGCFCESTQQVVVDRLNNELIGNQTDFNIYPNPNNGTFNIEITGNHQQSTIEIYSLVGELIASYNVEKNQVKTITLDNISKGIYLVKVNNEQNNKVRKVHIH